jgi:hypothetical protein
VSALPFLSVKVMSVLLKVALTCIAPAGTLRFAFFLVAIGLLVTYAILHPTS